MKTLCILSALILSASYLQANRISDSQQQYIKRYEKQKKKVAPEKALYNTDPEPDLSQPGFVDLYNGENLDGWVKHGGNCTFEAAGDKIIGKVVKKEKSTYLCTEREDYTDFILTAELYWEVNSNSGVMIRGKLKGKNNNTVYGPQVEMEGFQERGWSGAIYGQGAGGWFYPLWLDPHAEARKAIKEGWNRVTVKYVGNAIKTWVNGVPAAHWVDENNEYPEGYIGLQVHSGPAGEVHFRNVKILELDSTKTAQNTATKAPAAPAAVDGIDLFESGDFSEWTSWDGKPVSSKWTIEDGVVYRGGMKPGDIITKKKFKNFDLSFEWKISEAGNSGVKYRSKGRLGLEYQVLDDEKHGNGKNPLMTAGSMYALLGAPEEKPLKNVGEWNQGRIVVKDNHVEHWLNGAMIITADLSSDTWMNQFKKSKYKKHEGFGQWAGPILLQDHNDEVWYRNVIIKEL